MKKKSMKFGSFRDMVLRILSAFPLYSLIPEEKLIAAEFVVF